MRVIRTSFVIATFTLFILLPRTGRVAFDGMGDRLFAEYQVVNIQRQEEADTEPQHVTVGNYSYTNVRTQHDSILFILSTFLTIFTLLYLTDAIKVLNLTKFPVDL